MSVYRVKNSPFWQFDFQLKGYRFSGSTKARNEREAKEVEKAERRAAQRLVADIAATGRQPLTVGEAFDRWWNEHGKHLNDPDLKPRLEWLAEQIGRSARLHDITDDVVSSLVDLRRRDVMRAGRDEKGNQLYRPISARTVNKTVTSLLSRVLHRARDNWNVTILREPNWSKHKLAERKRPVREITIAEDAILDQVECPDYAALRHFAEIVGLRRRNLLLTWPQVDFDQALIRVLAKGDKPRTIPLSKDAYQILWARRGHHPMHVFTFVAQRTRVCPMTKKKFVRGVRYPMTYFGIGTNRRRKWAAAGVDARLHDTRHTTGMRTLRSTGNLKLVQRLLGHAKITTTADFYTDATLDDMLTGMERTAEHINLQKKSHSDSGADAKTLIGQKK